MRLVIAGQPAGLLEVVERRAEERPVDGCCWSVPVLQIRVQRGVGDLLLGLAKERKVGR